MDHPMVVKMNQCGYLGTVEQENIIETCKCCDKPLQRGTDIVEFQGHLYCDTDCLTDAFCDDPEAFGMEKTEIT
ncbi:hypothetical protein JUJ52_03020 [Virgibacillus sp. AGTR]|uniref:hypothetical protein n=1 Tax=Virgibacillus sp. AGTR TaxID=2812055 RepID=UPI001D160EF3|nr:hypothetical protein [Virgibacillus sp. AGTR]MCC2248929.1 hypothetical protein [Virgibacillus sp. AGTR]